MGPQQTPREQRPAQGVPHAPQLLASDVTSTHAPPQFVWVAGQHFPDEHFDPAQSPSSQQSELAMQPAPQRLKPGSHWIPHAPCEHVGVPPSTEGQAAQLEPHELTLVFERQRPLQSCVPTGHTPMQDCPSGMQAFAHTFLPSGHFGPQVVPLHVASPPVGAAHAVHEVPQLAGEVFEAHMPLQAWWPAAHVKPQRWLALQTAAPFATAGQSSFVQQLVLGMHCVPHFL